MIWPIWGNEETRGKKIYSKSNFKTHFYFVGSSLSFWLQLKGQLWPCLFATALNCLPCHLGVTFFCGSCRLGEQYKLMCGWYTLLTLNKLRTVPSWYVPSRRRPPNFQPISCSCLSRYVYLWSCRGAWEVFHSMAACCLKRIAIARLVFPARNRQAHLPAPSFC